ncbi:hypothetical protein [Dickeya oryzae]|uniref:DUF2269 family protein n=1 Tax=Dickeya oryzae TaxID=1240404 RepID=A0AB39IZF5_9GAMM|nr:hypothetical protein [Dickeya oryzae]MCA6993107.1 hypothetical protein [Dickeya oryzae]MCA6993618.1 hypothetical protein [Dickeya oryzae]
MLEYNLMKLLHALAAVAATGPLLFAPWLSWRLQSCQQNPEKQLLLSGLTITDRFYNVAGWLLMISGAVMLWLDDWHRLFQLWFVLSVAFFVIDSIAEKKWRDPATTALDTTGPGEPGWLLHTSRLHRAVLTQMGSTSLILLAMLLHNQLTMSLLSITSFIH